MNRVYFYNEKNLRDQVKDLRSLGCASDAVLTLPTSNHLASAFPLSLLA